MTIDTSSEPRVRLFAGLRQDFVFAARSLRRHPSFAITAMATLALGIGASTAIFSVVNTVLLRPLPYADADRLVLVWGDMRARNVSDFPFSPPNFKDLRTQNTTFTDLAALTPGNIPFTVPGEPPEQVSSMGVTTNLLSLLGARIAHGRNFVDADGELPPPPPAPAPGAPPAPQAVRPQLPAMIILNDGYWRRRFASDTSVIGKTVDVAGGPAMIVGVLAPGFEVLFPPNTHIVAVPDMVIAQRVNFETASRLNVFLRVIGKLKPGVALSSARQDAERVSAATRELAPIYKTADLHYRVEPMHDDLVADVRPAIFALMGAVIFVLLIACANVANLLLVRAAAREREIAVRVALGSSAWRVVRQLLAESVLLSLSGAVLAIGLTWAGIRLLMLLAPENLPRLGEVNIDPTVLGFATLASVLAAVLFGLVPALRASRPDIAHLLRAAGRAPGLAGGKLLLNTVVVAEVALAFVLLVGGGLMTRSFVELSRTSPGFDPHGVLKFTVGPRGGRSADQRIALMRTMRDRFAAIPGVSAVASVTPLPLDGQLINSRWGKEEAVTDPSKFRQANLHIVLPGYFEAMGTRVIAGRTFTDADDRPENTFVVIDDMLAGNAFPGQSAVGQRLFIRSRGQEAEWLNVIGVVQHQRHDGLATPGPQALFLPDGYFGHGFATTWVVRTSCAPGAPCDPTRLSAAVRGVVKDVDPLSPVAQLGAYQDLVDRAMTPTRFALVMIGIFAGVAAVLACVGLYGVLATAVRQRTAEIGVRVAFGASRPSIFALVLRDGMKLSAAGLAVGLLASLWLTRAMTTMLVGVQRTDVTTYVSIVGLFLVIAVLACLIPARRAASLDPTNALRAD
jgi:putative ABC transport system permease protein